MMTADNPDQRTPIADGHFSVEARLAIQLGRESISGSITAILELVKNVGPSYTPLAVPVWPGGAPPRPDGLTAPFSEEWAR